MRVELRRLALPSFGTPLSAPTIPAGEYEERIAAFRAAAAAEWLVVYGDREHFANLAFLTGFDPRFEEAILVLGPGDTRYLLVGNEGVGYAETASPRLDVVLCQSLSLMGQDWTASPTLEGCLREIGIASGARVGLAGWKYFDALGGFAAPAFLVDALRALAGEVVDVTAVLMAPNGLRARNSAAQVAAFEWAAARTSAAVLRVVQAAEPGRNEQEAVTAMGYAGEPLSAHVMFASGRGQIVGLRSPTARVLEEGDAVTTAVGYWGGLTCRAGVLRREVDDAFTETLGAPYFRALRAWYGAVRLEATGGDVFAAVEDALAGASFRPLLNPGHLIHLDEWVHSPIAKDAASRISSGMALQCDVIPTPVADGTALNCEDGIVVADEGLRAELAVAYPEVWARIAARQQFMRDELGIDLADEVLPLSSCPAYLPPFWLSPDLVYVAA